jgi:hypothetical protein
MAEIRDVDRAWEAIDVFRSALCQALAAVERMGGKDPAAECPNDAAVSRRRLELRKRCQDFIDTLLVPLNLKILIAAYKQTEEYGKLLHKSRRDYAARMRRIEREYGELPLRDVTSEDLKKWCALWSTNGVHPAMGKAVMTLVRILLRFGAKRFGDKDCARLAVQFPRFEKRKKVERKQINAAQLVAFRAQAHKMGLHRLALGVAIQYEVQLSQKQLIGHWVPMSDPGTSDVIRNEKKWLGGLDWSQIDADRILRLSSGDEIDLSECLIVMEELNRLPEIPDSGPIIVCEPLGVPYPENEYHFRWRKVATAAGIPKSVRNTYHPIRERAAVPLNKEQVWQKVTPICSPLPEVIRDDVRQQMIEDVLAGKIRIEQLPAAKDKYAAEQWKLQNRYTLSLDQTVGSRRLGDTISSDHNTWQA